MPVVTNDVDKSGFIFTMAIKECKTVNVLGVQDLITNTWWTLTGQLLECPDCGEEHTASFEGATPFINLRSDGKLNLDKVIPEELIAWEDLTEKVVIGWISEMLKTDIQPFVAINRQITEMHVAKSATGPDDDLKPNLPWAQ